MGEVLSKEEILEKAKQSFINAGEQSGSQRVAKKLAEDLHDAQVKIEELEGKEVKKVLVVVDQDAHCHVFPHDKWGERLNNYRGIIRELLRGMRDTEEDVAQLVLSTEWPEERESVILDLIHYSDGPGFDRSGGDTLYIVELSKFPFPGKLNRPLLGF